jgi:hypothetical protein
LSRQCFSYGPTGQRCSQPADHEGDHYIQVSWSDDESVTPDHFAMARVVGETRSVRPVPIIGIEDIEGDDDEPSLDRCAACNWPESDHASNPHGCKNFA